MNRYFAAIASAIAVVGIASTSQGAPMFYRAELSGANEDPPNASPATGHARVIVDLAAHTLDVRVSFSGLTAGNTAAHIHAATAVPFTGLAGVATTVPTFTGFPTGATSGTYSHLFDMTLASSYNPSFITAHGGTPGSAEAFLASSIADGKAYVNIHSSAFPAGEIRGFLQAVPEPSSLVIAVAGAACCCGVMWSRRR